MPKDPNLPNPEDRKKMMFWESPKRQADLRIRLQYDGFTQSHFFRAMITGYLEKNENLLRYLDEYKGKHLSQGINKIYLISLRRSFQNYERLCKKMSQTKHRL